LQVLDAELATTAVDEDLLARLDALRDDGVRVRGLDRDLTRAEEELASCETTQAGAERRLDELQRADEAAQAAVLAAAAARDDARNVCDAAADRHRAAVLRSHLHTGKACPVCLHPVADLPPADTPPELASLEAALRDAETRAQKADAVRSKAVAAVATAQERLTDAVAAVERAAARREKTAAAIAAALERILVAVAGADGVLAGMQVLDWIERERGQMTAAKAARDRLRQRQRELDKVRHEAALTHAGATAAAAQAQDRLTQLRNDQARIQEELAAVVARIAAVSTAPDPRAERDSLEREIARLRGAEGQAQQALATAEREFAAANERLKAAGRTLEEAEAHTARVQESLAAALSECGFATPADAESAVRSAEQQESLRRRITSYDQERATAQQRIRELEPQVVGGEVPQEMLLEAERRCKIAVAAWRDADQAVVRIESECVRLRTTVAERQQLMIARTANERVLTTTAEVATDLKSDRFQEYLLEEAFRGLVAGASVRMKSISSRYTLEWDAGEFYVVDHDNAGERRRAETLSGGETFMASLCLALQLSDEVLRTSGALRMDSLFIDEGFGTLDVDALSEVTDAMEALRHDGNRMIGVISHRPELTDRLPGCIRVNKAIGESAWLLEREG
jgi:DNA repair protein SbcC/Rad50